MKLRDATFVCALLSLVASAEGCVVAEESGCVASALGDQGLEAKADFEGEWSHVATLGFADADLGLEAAAETSRVILWTISEDVLTTSEEPPLGFSVAAHVILGRTSNGTACSIETEGEWFERDHFGVDWSADIIAAGESIPGASAAQLAEWRVDPVPVVDPLLFEPEFVHDSAGGLESLFFSLEYSVRTCEECEPLAVNVFHRFERRD